jgi:putative peptidoglycan lipid II flippase
LRRRLGRVDFRETSVSLLRILGASIALAAVCYAVWRPLDDVLGRSFGAQLLSLGTALAAGLIAYGISCRLLGVRELDALLSLRSRLRRA